MQQEWISITQGWGQMKKLWRIRIHSVLTLIWTAKAGSTVPNKVAVMVKSIGEWGVCVDMCLPCLRVLTRAVAQVTLIHGHAHPAVGARLGGAWVVGQLASGAVEESCTPAARLCRANKTPRHLRQEQLIKATASLPYRHEIIKAKVSKVRPESAAPCWCLKGKIVQALFSHG